MRSLLLIIMFLVGCGTDDLPPIDIPFVDIGNDYSCTVTMDCDGVHVDEPVSMCGPLDSAREVSIDLWDQCIEDAKAGCSSWACATECHTDGLCSL